MWRKFYKWTPIYSPINTYRKLFCCHICKSDSMNPLELTLAILKPSVCKIPQDVLVIRQLILDNNFYFVKSKCMTLNTKEAEFFYREHREKFFYKRLVSFMCSGAIAVHILGRENAIQHWRHLLGPTKVFKAQYEAPYSIRARFGISDTRNAAHGSDSSQTAEKEIRFFFPHFDIKKWYCEEEPFFHGHLVKFDRKNWVHLPYTSEKKKNVNSI
ncbi:nucleoside diphosphate kinase 6-like [Limulus polyphemus]|uniref:Nucleoside diphosphate kinase 6-like n=1 Tax=Limulus polyphemus TaxID=6850 RepID=A0ABM1C364_LIMPO|nr:nucleoside diphosphate kinase 6-like [Limulus polyphemus]